MIEEHSAALSNPTNDQVQRLRSERENAVTNFNLLRLLIYHSTKQTQIAKRTRRDRKNDELNNAPEDDEIDTLSNILLTMIKLLCPGVFGRVVADASRSSTPTLAARRFLHSTINRGSQLRGGTWSFIDICVTQVRWSLVCADLHLLFFS